VSRFQFVADHRHAFEVKRLCQSVEVSRSSFYAWETAAPGRAERAAADAALAEQIKAVQDPKQGGDRAYGAPRVTAELNDGVTLQDRVNHKRVARVMRSHHLPGLRLRRRVRTTVPEPANAKAQDLVKRDFTAPAPNVRYVGDITYLPLACGQNLYLATVIDCYSRRLVGWAVADHMRTDLITTALLDAASTRGNLTGAIFHGDHGAQYTSRAYAELCTKLGVRQSMGAVGSSADNALAESFNATLKRELLQGAAAWSDELSCRRDIFRWATRYNTRRRHSWCGQQAVRGHVRVPVGGHRMSHWWPAKVPTSRSSCLPGAEALSGDGGGVEASTVHRPGGSIVVCEEAVGRHHRLPRGRHVSRSRGDLRRHAQDREADRRAGPGRCRAG